jgi:hypothetical protein
MDKDKLSEKPEVISTFPGSTLDQNNDKLALKEAELKEEYKIEYLIDRE